MWVFTGQFRGSELSSLTRSRRLTTQNFLSAFWRACLLSARLPLPAVGFLFEKSVGYNDLVVVLRHLRLEVLFKIRLEFFQKLLRDWPVSPKVIVNMFTLHVSFS